MESPGRRQNHSGVVFAGGRPLSDDAIEVFGVFTDQCSTLRCGVSEKLFVGQLRPAWVVGSRHDVVAVQAKPCSRNIGNGVPRKRRGHRREDRTDPARPCRPRTKPAVYASDPASKDRAAADVVGERFFGENQKGRRHEISAPLPRQSFREVGRRRTLRHVIDQPRKSQKFPVQRPFSALSMYRKTPRNTAVSHCSAPFSRQFSEAKIGLQRCVGDPSKSTDVCGVTAPFDER